MTATASLAGKRVLLGVSGGIAAYKSASLARLLRDRGAEVQVIMTAAATRFVGRETFSALTGRPVPRDLFEASETVRHVQLAQEADAAIVAPATANVLAKLALGMADDVLTATLLEFRGPLVVAPAMHSGMHEAPATQANLETLRARGVRVVGPASGPLAAGDEGVGRMVEPDEIVFALEDLLGDAGDLSGRRIVVTAGPTHEPLDAVRFVGNRSSGRMGFALAREAATRGGMVTLVTGPTHLEDPPGVSVVRVETAEEMRAAVLDVWEDAEAVIKAAAVADFRPKAPASGKLKKEHGPPDVHLEPTPDILAELGERKGERVLVGFAAETDELEKAGREKLRRKRLDLVVVNEVGAPGTGFDAETNRAMLLSADGRDEPLRLWTKEALAAAVLDRVAELL
ncbi:MAG: bifunctional phosphopantothenoylcysteine decarboxylase/phosphopantothenate--cysteine ligase CoaBC [Actinomycetota bacterium]